MQSIRCSLLLTIVAWSVCLSIAHNCDPHKNSWTDWGATWDVDADGPKKPGVKWGLRCPQGGDFGGIFEPIVKYRECLGWASYLVSSGSDAAFCYQQVVPCGCFECVMAVCECRSTITASSVLNCKHHLAAFLTNLCPTSRHGFHCCSGIRMMPWIRGPPQKQSCSSITEHHRLLAWEMLSNFCMLLCFKYHFCVTVVVISRFFTVFAVMILNL